MIINFRSAHMYDNNFLSSSCDDDIYRASLFLHICYSQLNLLSYTYKKENNDIPVGSRTGLAAVFGSPVQHMKKNRLTWVLRQNVASHNVYVT